MTGVEVALIAGTVASTVGAIASSNAQAAAAEGAANAASYKQAVANRNATIAAQKRHLRVQQARSDAEDVRRKNSRRMSQMRANYGASGVDLAGTPLDVLEDASAELELDAQRIEHQGKVAGYEGALQILGLQDDAALAGMERDNARSRAKSAKTAGYINAFGTAVSGYGTTMQTDYAKANWS